MEATITLELSRHVIQAARVTPAELRIELAVHLYTSQRLSLGHARELADWEFRQLLAGRKIAPHYEVADLDADMQTWAELDSP